MRFRFSIRDLLLVVVIAALASGWCVDHRRLAEANEQLVEATTTYREIKEIPHGVARQEILKSLKEAFSDQPEVTLADDPKVNGIVIIANRGEHSAIDLAIRSLALLNGEAR
jgi:hypothetical protein